VLEHADLQTFNTLAVPSTARYLTTAESVDQLKAALQWARDRQLDCLILGGGSNVVLPAQYAGLVVLNRLRDIELISQQGDQRIVKVAAGENWHDLVKYCVDHQWYGLENLALIPGLVGAAPIQNIGAYGVELKDVLIELTCLDKATGKRQVLSNADCQFDYRHSIFKDSLRDQMIVTDLTLALSTRAVGNISYPALQQLCGGSDHPRQIFAAVCQIRRSKLPDPTDLPNVGSFFKNPIVDATQLKELQTRYPDIVFFKFGRNYKLAAAWLIEQRGWKSRLVEGVKVHEDQALVIINPEHASGLAVLKLANKIQNDIESHYGLQLEIEPTLV